MITLLGDLHGALDLGLQLALRSFGRMFRMPSPPVIQVGDLGWWPDARLPRLPFPIHFVDGNHDHLPSLLPYTEPTEVYPNLIYCPRGSVLTLDGRRVGFLGGARSVDRELRVRGETWFEEEELTVRQARRLEGESLDLLVSHTPPASIVQAMGYDVPDRSSEVVQSVWEALDKPPLFCGHMHRRYQQDGVTVLAEFGVEIVP